MRLSELYSRVSIGSHRHRIIDRLAERLRTDHLHPDSGRGERGQQQTDAEPAGLPHAPPDGTFAYPNSQLQQLPSNASPPASISNRHLFDQRNRFFRNP